MSKQEPATLEKRLQAIAARAAAKRHERDSFSTAEAAATALAAYITFILVTL